ncbi:diadenylate cyclase CdaA [Peptoniphilus sp. GNH]|nr:TIGR00159 family protein [Clostridiales bacterium KA00134]UHR03176.1 diadenylate cyclase CdaA [Peptoniphilus sp. GNH]
MQYIENFFNTIRFRDIVDIVIVAYLVYNGLKIIRGTRAQQVAKGIIIILILSYLTDKFQINTVYWIFKSLFSYGFMIIIVVFQPELRRALEYIGRSSSFASQGSSRDDTPETVKEISLAVASLARQKIGALIVLEKRTGLKEIIETGTKIDGKVSSSLLINIFIPNTPLHDGAAIIRDSRIVAASCFLPLTDNNSLPKDLGTRHRAALGISEKSDCLAIVVSEETGSISIAENGEISRYLDIENFEKILLDAYNKNLNAIGSFLDKWRLTNEGTNDEKTQK